MSLTHYNPNVAPSPAQWRALGEAMAHLLVERYYTSPQCEHDPAPNPRMHAAIHVVVENQAAPGDETPVAAKLAQLMHEGLSRHDAIHAIGSLLAQHLHEILQEDPATAEASNARYYAKLAPLTAEPWLQTADADDAELPTLPDDDLIDLLFSEEDRLSRAAVDEIVARRERLTIALVAIIIDPRNWNVDLPEWWAPIHAAFILGAIDDPIGDTALFSALRDAEAFDYDWLTTEMPSILGRRGARIRPVLSQIIANRDEAPIIRVGCLRALAATALTDGDDRDAIFAQIGTVFTDDTEDPDVRADAGQILLDFQIASYRDALCAFAREQTSAALNFVPFCEEDVVQAFAQGPSLAWYERDWLSFYDPDEIAARQARWAREAAEEEAQRASAKVGRNDPCPCGSGKKYKKCHGA